MPRDRDNRPRRDEEKKNETAEAGLNQKEKESTYVKNANASGMGSLGRSDENNIEETDSEDRVY